VADRREVTESLGGARAESICTSNGPVGARVQAVSGPHALQPLFQVHTSRQRYAIHDPTSEAPLGEIALDDTVICRPDGQPESKIQRVEVEALAESHQPLETLVNAMRDGCSLESAAESKYAEGLKSVGLAPASAPTFGPTRIEPSMGLDEIAVANLRRYLSAWCLHEPGARLGDDPEQLHDLRVAGRRLDAVLREFGGYLPEALLRLRPTLKSVLRMLGEARDLDVALSELESYHGKLSEEDRRSLAPLTEHLCAERGRVRSRMLELLDSPAVQGELRAFALALKPSPAESPPISTISPGLPDLPGLIRLRYKKARRQADRLTKKSSMEDYHVLRGRVKRLRYLIESTEAIFGKGAAAMARDLRRWQEGLGEQQDADVAHQRLRTLASSPPDGLPSETLFLMGRLAEHYAGKALKARKLHAGAYRRVRERWKAFKPKLTPLESGART
jgi:CHAD domain-containing protein